MEPALACVAALHSPSTGIVDSHALMLALLGEAESHGAQLALNTRIVSGRIANGRVEIEARDADSGDVMALSARCFINAAGLGAQAIAHSILGFPLAMIPQQHLARGHYFSLSSKNPFSRLIYPVPVDGGLGTHLTLDLGGQARFGPDVEWIDTLDYSVDPRHAAGFEMRNPHLLAGSA